MKNSTHLIEQVLLNKIIDKDQLKKAKEIQSKKLIGLEDALVELGYTTHKEIIKCLSCIMICRCLILRTWRYLTK